MYMPLYLVVLFCFLILLAFSKSYSVHITKMANPGIIKFVTYNIDGLQEIAQRKRTMAAVNLILAENPDVIHLQEVVPETVNIVTKTFTRNGYKALHDFGVSMIHYFTMTFIKDIYAKTATAQRISFTDPGSSSQQGRDLLLTRVTFNGVGPEWLFINCHLESQGAAMKSPNSFKRISQLTEALTLISQHLGPAVVAGDLNIRNPEAAKVLSQLHEAGTKINDAAEFVFPGAKHKGTWYMPGKPFVSSRYDRVYSNNKQSLNPITYTVKGADSIHDESVSTDEHGVPLAYLTPSDHRCLVVAFQINQSALISPVTRPASPTSSSRSISSTVKRKSFVPAIEPDNSSRVNKQSTWQRKIASSRIAIDNNSSKGSNCDSFGNTTTFEPNVVNLCDSSPDSVN